MCRRDRCRLVRDGMMKTACFAALLTPLMYAGASAEAGPAGAPATTPPAAGRWLGGSLWARATGPTQWTVLVDDKPIASLTVPEYSKLYTLTPVARTP